jgi:hypothetical protein
MQNVSCRSDWQPAFVSSFPDQLPKVFLWLASSLGDCLEQPTQPYGDFEGLGIGMEQCCAAHQIAVRACIKLLDGMYMLHGRIRRRALVGAS